MLSANVIIIPILQRQREKHQLTHLHKTYNSVIHPAGPLGLLPPLNSEALPRDYTSAQFPNPTAEQHDKREKKRRHETKEEEKSCLQQGLCTTFMNECMLTWDGHFQLRIREAKPSTMPATARTKNGLLKGKFLKFHTLELVGGRSHPRILMASQAHIFGFHQKVIIGRDVWLSRLSI